MKRIQVLDRYKDNFQAIRIVGALFITGDAVVTVGALPITEDAIGTVGALLITEDAAVEVQFMKTCE